MQTTAAIHARSTGGQIRNLQTDFPLISTPLIPSYDAELTHRRQRHVGLLGNLFEYLEQNLIDINILGLSLKV